MNRVDAEKRIIKLRELINDYRYHYHVLDESIMSEAAADSLKHELTVLEAEFPELITPDSPTQRVAGKPLDKFEKVAHEKRMISLADVFSREEILDWISRNEKLVPGGKINEFFTDIKMDGLACSLKYRDGVFYQAVTRGDGLVGEDVTLNLKTIENIPLRISGLGETEVRGEIVIFKKDFEKLNEIFTDVLDLDECNLTDKTSADDIEEWDSLSHIQLIVAIEKAFIIKFTSLEIMKWNNVGEMVDSMMEKL